MHHTVITATECHAVAAGRGGQGGTVAPGRRRMGGAAPGDGAKFFW